MFLICQVSSPALSMIFSTAADRSAKAIAGGELTAEKNGLITLLIESPEGGQINWTAAIR